MTPAAVDADGAQARRELAERTARQRGQHRRLHDEDHERQQRRQRVGRGGLVGEEAGRAEDRDHHEAGGEPVDEQGEHAPSPGRGLEGHGGGRHRIRLGRRRGALHDRGTCYIPETNRIRSRNCPCLGWRASRCNAAPDSPPADFVGSSRPRQPRRTNVPEQRRAAQVPEGRGRRDGRRPLLRPARSDAALHRAGLVVRPVRLRRRPRLRRLVDPWVPGDPRVRHVAVPGPDHGVPRPVPRREDAGRELLHPRPAHR